jgi:chemotaxis protein methyltransferase CheR
MSLTYTQTCAAPSKTMSNAEFDQLSEFIHDQCGIKMPVAKKIMLEARLQKRLRSLGLGSYGEYCDYVFNSPDRENEYVRMIDCVTTHKTDFFREPVHFQFLADTLLPEFVNTGGAGRGRAFTVWSAACSTGEEPYTLAMTLSEFAANNQGFEFSVVASDISTQVLEKARLAIYGEEQAACVPAELKRKYILRGKDASRGLVRFTPGLRGSVHFKRVNLMDERPFPAETMDAIFCRNVMIYFDRETQKKLLGRLCGCLKPGGHLFLGHSETMYGSELPVVRITSTIYRKTQ